MLTEIIRARIEQVLTKTVCLSRQTKICISVSIAEALFFSYATIHFITWIENIFPLFMILNVILFFVLSSIYRSSN